MTGPHQRFDFPKLHLCQIDQVGKQRTGMPRFWCSTHQASATGRYGVRLERCESAHLDRTYIEPLKLSPGDYRGGIGIWGAVEPIYDSTNLDTESGIHVHARKSSESTIKHIDSTYDAVELMYQKDLFENIPLLITADAAISYYVTNFFFGEPKALYCIHCGEPHLDSGYFAVHPHRRHLCHKCGRIFQDSNRGISNPITILKEIWRDNIKQSKIIDASHHLDIRQRDFPGGLRLWASNPAILWTAKKEEQRGIHLHGYPSEGCVPVPDETYASVKIDGINLEVDHVHHLMAQRTLKHLKNKLVSLQCPQCNLPHFDQGILAVTPHVIHECSGCHYKFIGPERRRKVISNPLVNQLKQLHELRLGRL